MRRVRAAAGWLLSAADWLWRDPVQAVAAEVRSPRLRALCHGLIALRLAIGDLSPTDALAALRWRLGGARLTRGGDGVIRALTAAGAPIAHWPRRLRLTVRSAAMVCATGADGSFLRGVHVTPARGAVIVSPRGRWTLRAFPLGDGDPDLCAAPVLGGSVLIAELRRGLGWEEALRRALPPRPRRMGSPPDGRYRRWLKRQAVGPFAASETAPILSVLMPVRDPDPRDLEAAIASVFAQSHPRWELCLCDDGSAQAEVRRMLDRAAADPRVKLAILPSCSGVAAATNAALAMATGELVGFLDHDDLLTPDALAAMAAAFADPAVQGAYSDEDTVDAAGRPRAPTFKTRFDGERLLSQNFVNHLFCIRTALLRRLGGLRDGYQGAQDHDLVLRVAEAVAPGAIRHVPSVLYRWRRFPGGTSLSQAGPGRAADARRRAVADHLARRGLIAAVAAAPEGFNRLTWPLASPPPPVRVIVPTRDRPDLLEGCVRSLLALTAYPQLEVVIVDNGSTEVAALHALDTLAATAGVRVLSRPGPFDHSAMNNAAAEEDGAQVLCLLNDDILVVEPDWLTEMVRLAIRPDVGAVGAKLLYPDGRIQHAGVVLGLGSLAVAGHELRGAPAGAVGLQSRLVVPREVDAVTAACLVVERRKFLDVGGFDEEAFPVAFNDVDLCLRMERAGLRTLWTPYARLIHLESASRRRQDFAARQQALEADAARMAARWGERLTSRADYHPALSRQDETFSLA